MKNIIAAVSKDGFIGKNNTIPWHYKSDFQYFKKKTSEGNDPILIMGHNTYLSIGKPLPGRETRVISTASFDGVKSYETISDALVEDRDIWFAGGATIYQEAMKYADGIYLTLIPDEVNGDVKFPWINPLMFKLDNISDLDETLKVAYYKRT
jgi:dihydrofolate reductase